MPDLTSDRMQHHEFESLLSDALDGALSGRKLVAFQAHARSCSVCGPLLAEVEAGRKWLKGLTEVEPPASLVHDILASTTGVDARRQGASIAAPQFSWWERAQAWTSAGLEPIWATVRQPRFAMSFGMAFFSLSVALSMLGVRPSDLRQISLRPAAIRHTFYNTQARVVRYYENIRFVYEVESRVRELKRNMTPAEPAPEKKDHKNDTTEQPEQKQERNYSQSQDQLILACVPLGPSENEASVNDPSVVSVTTYRRFV